MRRHPAVPARGYDVNLVWVQCGSCLHRWWHDTGVGSRRHPKHLLCELFDAA
ncbi:MAG: hypothetical protein M3460_25550 [Actinomycetota bacterium]|nr:hypothetical protein [Actinomycetota bacterium]